MDAAAKTLHLDPDGQAVAVPDGLVPPILAALGVPAAALRTAILARG